VLLPSITCDKRARHRGAFQGKSDTCKKYVQNMYKILKIIKIHGAKIGHVRIEL